MTKFGSLADRTQQGGATSVAPLVSTPATKGNPNRGRRIALATFAVIGMGIAGARLVWFIPAVQDWRLQGMSLDALVKERGSVSNDPRLLYHVGLRLNEMGRFADAESNLQRAVGLDPESARLRDEWTRAQLGSGKISEAFTQLRQFVGTHPRSADAHLALGKFYFSQNSMQRAREEFETTTSLAPNHAEGWAYLSQAASQLELPNQPVVAAKKAVSLAPNNAGYHLLLANLLPATDPTTARKEFARAVELSPSNAIMHQQFALFLANQTASPEDRKLAESEARKALAIDAKDAPSLLLLGRLLQESGRSSEAIKPLTEAATLLPEDPVAARTLFDAYKSLGNAVDAEKWQKIWHERQDYVKERQALYFQLGAKPDSRELHRKLARLLGLHGDVEGTVRNYSAALRRAPDSVQTLIAAAHDLTEGGYADRALPLAERATTLGPYSPEAHEAYADALLQSNRIDKAVAHYNLVTNYQPNRAKELQARVDAYAKAHPQPISPAEKAYREARSLVDGQIGLKRSPQRALELAEEANRLSSGNVAYMQLLLKLQFGARKTEDAIKTARQIANLAPYDSPTQALLGVMLAERAETPEQLTEAESYLTNVKNAPNAAAQYHYGMGLLALRKKDGPTAVTELTQAAQLDTDADITFYKLSQAESMSGHTEAAAKALAEYERRQAMRREEFGLQGNISQRPDDPAAYEGLAAFYDRNGRKAEAATMREIARRRFAAKSGNATGSH